LDNSDLVNLYLQHDRPRADPGTRAVIVGEVLWDRLPDATRLGGAPLNFAVHFARFGHRPMLVSAVGADAAGEDARQAIAALGVDTRFVHTTDCFPTGLATVHIGPGEDTTFTIERPAAYDAIELSACDLRELADPPPSWIYYGTLFPSRAEARRVLNRLLDAFPDAARFYDLNLRPGFDSPGLVAELLETADVVKLNEDELRFVHTQLRLPADPEAFCCEGSRRYGWRAACVTLGAHGCAMLAGQDYAWAPAIGVDVVDPVGTGDAFAAAFLHGILLDWPVARIARLANQVGAFVAGTHGAIPAGFPWQVARR